jgi:serine/threonine protein kinase
MSAKSKRLANIGGWQLIEQLGKGGNGVVFKAEKDGRQAAIKVLRSNHWDKKRQARFKDEIEAMRRCEALGCLPVLESEVPEKTSDKQPAWFAMSLADPMLAALGEAPTVACVVECIRDIAALMAKIHSMGIAHRDIKPDNLFRFDGRWTVGDFGLADFDGKAALTTVGEKIGPTFYIAPEMLNDSLGSDGMPADVFSIAKTLWVLITGQRFPIPGPLTANIEALRASSYVSDARAPLLDAILEAATDHAPSTRPTMNAFAQELTEWLCPTVMKGADAQIDLSQYAAMLAVPKYQMEATMAASSIEQQRIHETGNRLQAKLRPLFNQLAESLTAANFIAVNANTENYFWGGELRGAVPRANNSLGFARIQMNVSGDYQDPTMARLSASYQVVVDNKSSIEVWKTSTSFLPAGSTEDAAVANLLSEIRSQFKTVVAQVIAANESLG